MVEKGDFGILVLKEDLDEKNFAELILMVLNKGLRKTLGIIEPLISNMDEGL